MYAVVKVAGFQYLVREGDTVTVPRLTADAGTKIKLDQVLFVRSDDQAVVGRPTVANSYVEAEVVDHPRTKKVQLVKFRRREKYRRKKGHRQPVTRLRVSKIHYEG